ncbi:MAG TPA: protein kinase [Polyangiaceae bacterium]|jgi:serine/threonine protein kinase|nr:protein kinase [Polyangiaceae bacterium]
MFPQIFGKYVLEREIAAGGMARVYLATLRGAVGFEKRLVVKQIRTELASDEAFVTRFVEEAKTAVELSHPNIVPVYELGVEQGVYYIAMELCEGLTLSEVLAETGPLGPAEGAYVGAEICRALDYAHRRANIVHRDVTPRNVLIDDEGEVRLIDFGIAAPVTRADDTARSEVFGSPGHMPPEQLHGADLTPATDVFAVGVLLIEAWTGYPPFRRATAQESERALFSAPPPIDRNEPLLSPLALLIASSVALDARDRPSAAEQLARPLREFLKSEDSGDIARRLGERVRRSRRRSRSSSPWLPGETGTGESAAKTRPLSSEAPSHGERTPAGSAPVTRTFAARDDLEIWTRRLSSAPAPLLATPAATPRSRRLAEARATASESADSDDGAREPPAISSSRISNAPQTSTGMALVAGFSAAFVALAFAFASHREAPNTNNAAHAPSAVPPPVASASAGLVPEIPSASLAASADTAPRVLPLARPQKSSEAPHNANPRLDAGADSEQYGVLRVTADPRATVEVSGPNFHEVRQTPALGLKLPSGKYQIVFRNDTFGTPVNAQVTVVAGASRSVHADFRLAEPTVTIH